MRAFLGYTAARLALFAAAFGVVYLLGARGFLAAVLALVVSGLVSYVLLAPQRDAMSESISSGFGRIKEVGSRLDEGAGKEDPATDSSGSAASSGATSE